MARKRKPDTRRRSGSRHKDRHTLSLSGDEYDQLGELAQLRGETIRDVGRAAVRTALEQAGLWPPPTASAATDQADRLGIEDVSGPDQG